MSERPRWDVQGLTPLVMGAVSIVMGTLYLFYIHRKVPETLYDRQCPNRKDYSTLYPDGRIAFGSTDEWLDEAAKAGKFPEPGENSSQSKPSSSREFKKSEQPSKTIATGRSSHKSLSESKPPEEPSNEPSVDTLSTIKEPSPSGGNLSNKKESDPESVDTLLDPSLSPKTPEGQPSTATSSSTIEDVSLPATMK